MTGDPAQDTVLPLLLATSFPVFSIFWARRFRAARDPKAAGNALFTAWAYIVVGALQCWLQSSHFAQRSPAGGIAVGTAGGALVIAALVVTIRAQRAKRYGIGTD